LLLPTSTYVMLYSALQHCLLADLRSASCHQLFIPCNQHSMFDVGLSLWLTQWPGVCYLTLFVMWSCDTFDWQFPT